MIEPVGSDYLDTSSPLRLPATEIELLRLIAQLFLEAHEQDDLWIDGVHGAAKLAEALQIAKEWTDRFPLPSEED